MTKEYKYTNSHTSPNHGKNYDRDLYHTDSYFYRVWQIEKRILKSLLIKRKKLKILDFACGTGRVTEYLEEISMSDITGIDVSSEMLKEAKKKLKETRLVNADLTRDSVIRNNLKKFHTITAFRFFLNADPSLRETALVSLKKALKDNGILIFNIHGNKISYRFFTLLIANFIDKIVGPIKKEKVNTIKYRKQLSIYEVKNLLSSNGYDILDVYSYSFIPASLSFFIPFKFWMEIEKRLINKSILLGSHLLFVAIKSKNVKIHNE